MVLDNIQYPQDSSAQSEICPGQDLAKKRRLNDIRPDRIIHSPDVLVLSDILHAFSHSPNPIGSCLEDSYLFCLGLYHNLDWNLASGTHFPDAIDILHAFSNCPVLPSTMGSCIENPYLFCCGFYHNLDWNLGKGSILYAILLP